MEANELYDLVLSKLNHPKITPLHSAMMLDCCNNVLKQEQKHEDIETLYSMVIYLVVLNDELIKGILNICIQFLHEENVTLNYLDQKIVINKDSNWLKSAIVL